MNATEIPSTTERPSCDICHRPMVRTPARRSFYCPARDDRMHRRERELRRLRREVEAIERHIEQGESK